LVTTAAPLPSPAGRCTGSQRLWRAQSNDDDSQKRGSCGAQQARREWGGPRQPKRSSGSPAKCADACSGCARLGAQTGEPAPGARTGAGRQPIARTVCRKRDLALALIATHFTALMPLIPRGPGANLRRTHERGDQWPPLGERPCGYLCGQTGDHRG
jgi:hypothetical protein